MSSDESELKLCLDCEVRPRCRGLSVCRECQRIRVAASEGRVKSPTERHLELLRQVYGRRLYPSWLATRL